MAEMHGRVLGQYELIDVLGTGGMAVIYRAYQRSMDREVAVKVIDPKLGTQPNFVQRFEREARVAASLNHRHIVKIFDYGEVDGTVYFAMELLTRGSLSRMMAQQRPLPTLQILEQTASALDFAHQRGIVHRDLKPDNILLDDDLNAVLTDFGIAKLTGLMRRTSLTTSNTLLGTPSYMAPEQWREGNTVDSRADIYSLGVITYQMLTGKLPFNATTPYQMMFAHINEPPIPLTMHRADLPIMVDTVINKALAKSPADRFPSATAFVGALKQAISGIMPEGLVLAPSASVDGRVTPVILDTYGLNEKTHVLTADQAIPVPDKLRSRRWLGGVSIVAGIAALAMIAVILRGANNQIALQNTTTPSPQATTTSTATVLSVPSATAPPVSRVPIVNVSAKLANPNASSSLQTLYNALWSAPERESQRLLVGEAGGKGSDKFVGTLESYQQETAQQTGEAFPVLAIDLANMAFDEISVMNYLTAAVQRGQILFISWEADNPWDPERHASCVQPDCPTRSVLELTRTQTDAARRYMQQLDKVANFLLKLQDAHAVIIWRPFVDMNAYWYWWHKQSSDDFVALWQHMFNYFTNLKGLDNLLWAYVPSCYADSNMPHGVDYYYPGAAYVDVVGVNCFYGSGQQHLDLDSGGVYGLLKAFKKPIGLFYWSPLPTSAGSNDPRFDLLDLLGDIRQKYPQIVFVCSWEWIWRMSYHNNLNAFMHDPWVITLGTLSTAIGQP